MSFFCCPVCKKELENNGGSLRCKNGHSYDISKSGYVNLLLSNQMNTLSPGDNKLMISSRRDFLNKGYYNKLAEKLCETVKKYAFEKISILDAGCGEGYYTEKVCGSIKNFNPSVLGIDISKFAAEAAAKRKCGADFAVASIFHMPVFDSSFDMLITLFAPFCEEEFHRILKPHGIMIMVIPDERHLFEFKQKIYDSPYLNQVGDYSLESFEFIEAIKVSDRITIDNNKDIMNLFSMTPYYYKTGIEGSERVSQMNDLETEIAFQILVYKSC